MPIPLCSALAKVASPDTKEQILQLLSVGLASTVGICFGEAGTEKAICKPSLLPHCCQDGKRTPFEATLSSS